MTLTPGKLILDQSPEVLYDSNESPSLDLRFAENKTLDDYVSGTPLVDHQRRMSGSNLSPGTFVNSNGLIETTPANYLIQSETVDQWSKGTGVAVTADATTAPDGTLTADRVQILTGDSVFTSTAGYALKPNTTYTASIYVKDNGTGLYIQELDDKGFGGLRYRTQFTFSTKTFTLQGTGIANMATPMYQEVGDGWFRIIQTITVQSNPSSLIFMNRYGVQDNFLWGAQLEEGSTATTYIPTTNVPSAAPRFDHNPTTGESLGLLIEESRTNVVVKSIPGGSGWVESTLVGTPNATTAPDGTVTAKKYEPTGPSDPNSMRVYTFPVSGGSNITRTGTIFAKAGTTDQLFMRGLENSGAIAIDLTTGIVSSNTSQSIVNATQYPDGWWRISLTVTNSNAILYCAVVGGISGSFYIWGAQIEEGSFATSYIPTAGTALTRNADVASITGTDFSSWYTPNPQTWFVKYKTPYVVANVHNPTVLNLGAETYIDNIAVRVQSSTSTLVWDNRSPTTFVVGVFTQNAQQGAYALSVDLPQGALSQAVNGDVIADTFTAKPFGSTTGMYIGTAGGATFKAMNGPISRLIYYPYRLADTRLQSLTA